MRGEIVKATPANMVVYDMMEREVFEEEKLAKRASKQEMIPPFFSRLL